MIKKLLFIVFCLYVNNNFAQTFSKYYQNNPFASVVITPDNGFLSLGEMNFEGNEYFFLLKTNDCGLMEWNFLFKDSLRLAANIKAACLMEDNEGNYLVYGHVDNGPLGERDLYVAKFDVNMNMLWSRYYGGLDAENAAWVGGQTYNNSIFQTMDNHYVFTAQTRTEYAGFGSSAQIIKINKDNGVPVWSKIYRLGSAGFATNAIETSDGGIVVVGQGDPGTLAKDAWIFKTDDTGAVSWSTQINHDIGSPVDDLFFDIAETVDSSLVTLASTSGNSEGGAWIIKFNELGNLDWHRTYGNTASGIGLYARDIKITPDNGLLIGGNHTTITAANSNGFLLKTDNVGTLEWANAYNRSDGCALPGFYLGIYDVQLTSDGGYICAGDQLIKTDSDGISVCYNIPFSPANTVPGINTSSSMPGVASVNVSHVSLNSDSIINNILLTEYNMCYQVIPDFKFDTASICPGDSVHFTDLSKIIFLDSANVCSDQSCCMLNTWNWDFDDPNSGTANTSDLQNPVHLFRDSRGFGVELTSGFELCTQTKWRYVAKDGPVGFVQDTFICKGDSVQLDDNVFSSIDVFKYQWTPSATLDNDTIQHPLAFPLSTTLYTVYLIDTTPLCNDTFSVWVYVIDTLAAPDVVCDSNALTYISFDWNDTIGATEYQISLDTGNTWINLSETFFDIGGFFQPGDSLTLLFRFSGPCGDGLISEKTCYTKDCDTADYTFLDDTAVCYGQPLLLLINGLNINNNPYSIIWNNGTASKDTSVFLSMINQSAVYSIEIIDSNQLICPSVYDTADIVVNLLPEVRIDDVDTGINCGSQIQLMASGAQDYTWVVVGSDLSNTSIANPIATIISSSTFIVTGSDSNNCEDMDSINIECKDSFSLFVPNAIHINSENEVFKLFTSGLAEIELRIYDRLGKLVFYSTDISTMWDGTFNGQNVTSGVYTYKIDAVSYGKSSIERKGNITLIW